MEKCIKTEHPILVIGIGNPGREDDGAAVEAVQLLEKNLPENVTVCYDYQLNIEDVLDISNKKAVIFVDASMADIDCVRLTEVTAQSWLDFTTHEMSPGGILGLCNQLYGTAPRAWLLEIKGYSWRMKEGLTVQAMKNVEIAYIRLKQTIQNIIWESQH